MLFLIIGRDGKDNRSLERRMAARQAHLALGDQLVKDGHMWYGAAILNSEGEMVGSVLIMNFTSQKELDKWLRVEPYVIENVWQELEIQKCNVNNPWQFSHSKKWFQNR